jgi:predicted nuclease of predicted toxin-antitoxin system
MLPPAAAQRWREVGHDAVSVLDLGIGAAPDADVFDRAVQESRVIVTENFADYASLLAERRARGTSGVAIVFVRRDTLPRRGALAVHLARKLDAWSLANPEPFIGLHWP